MYRLSKLQAKPFDIDTPVITGSSRHEVLFESLYNVPRFGATVPIGFSRPIVPLSITMNQA